MIANAWKWDDSNEKTKRELDIKNVIRVYEEITRHSHRGNRFYPNNRHYGDLKLRVIPLFLSADR